MTDRQRNKLKRQEALKSKRLREHLSSSDEPNGLSPLSELGIREADLTHEFLLGRKGCSRTPILGLLVQKGYLPQIPEGCLPASVVLAARNYSGCMDGIGTNRLSFLQYCASIGKYDSLPRCYRSKAYVCRKPKGIAGGFSPLTVAAMHGRLFGMPLACLKAGDLTPEEICHAQINNEIEVIESLLLPQDIEHIDLHYCFLTKYFPNWVRRHLTIKKLFSYRNRLSVILVAATTGCINYLPISLLKGHYTELHKIGDLARRQMIKSAVPSRVMKRRLVRIEEWLLEMADEALRDRGSEIRGRQLSFKHSASI